MSVERYRKRPVEIEAVQWDGTAEGATVVIDWVLSHDGTARIRDYPPTMHDVACRCDGRGVVPGGGLTADLIPCPETEPTGGRPPDIAIDTLEGTMTASPGDWIIRGVQGEFYPIKDAIFRETYEPATDADSPIEYVYAASFGADRGALRVWRWVGTDEWTSTFRAGHVWFSPTREVRWPTPRAALNGALAEGVVLGDG